MPKTTPQSHKQIHTPIATHTRVLRTHTTPVCTQTPAASSHCQVSRCPCRETSMKDAEINCHLYPFALSFSIAYAHARTATHTRTDKQHMLIVFGVLFSQLVSFLNHQNEMNMRHNSGKQCPHMYLLTSHFSPWT